MQDEEFLDLFKPKDQQDAPPERRPHPVEDRPAGDAMGATQPPPTFAPPPESPAAAPHVADAPLWEIGEEVEPLPGDGEQGCTRRTVGMAAGGGCLLLILLIVVVFAFTQVFGGKDEDDDDVAAGTLTLTPFIAFTPSAPTLPVTESPLVVPLVSSSDVRVPVALPERLTIGETAFDVQSVRSPAGDWPDAPARGDAVAWAYGTVINYILRLQPTAANRTLLSALQVDDSLSLHMSSGLILNFNVNEVMSEVADEAVLFRQISPRITLVLLDSSSGFVQYTVVTALFFDDEVREETLPTGAIAGLVNTPVDQGPVRITVLEAYQVAAAAAGLPGGAGYLLLDFSVENLGTAVLETEFFQTFVNNAAGERYPLTIPAGQFAHYGLPTDPLAPGEKVIGSAGYLVPGSSGGQVHWAFNPLPGSDYWVIVPLSYDLPAITPTPEPPPPVGFANVSVDSSGVFVDQNSGLLIVGLEVENISEGTVQVTQNDISLSSSGGLINLETAAPPLPWRVEPGQFRFFELQFDLPFSNDALLDVLGYTFSIDNIGGE